MHTEWSNFVDFQHLSLALIDHLARAAGVAAEVPGWLSASLHRSLDGTRVVNYAQSADLDAAHRIIEHLLAKGMIQGNKAFALMPTGSIHLIGQGRPACGSHRYRRNMPVLIAPTVRLRAAWLEAHKEWGAGVHEDGFGLRSSDDVDSVAGFEAWVARLAEEAGAGVGCIYWWIVEGDEVLGGIALRYGESEFVEWAGHIGYGIRPSARRRGLATWAIGLMIDEARKLDMERMLIVCAIDNIASAKTIERCGGVLECIRDTQLGPARRYWIDISDKFNGTDY